MTAIARPADGRPQPAEADAYYFRYIDRVEGDAVLPVLRAQLVELPAFAAGISEERSLHRYAPGKWSLREVLGHVADVERLMLARAFWFARGMPETLPSFEEDVAARFAGSHEVAWARLLADWKAARASSLAFLDNLPDPAWERTGTASGRVFSVRALAYILAGHVLHHMAVIRERYR